MTPTLHRFIFIIPDGMSCEFRVDPVRIAKLKPKARTRCISSLWDRINEFYQHIPESNRDAFWAWSIKVNAFAQNGELNP